MFHSIMKKVYKTCSENLTKSSLMQSYRRIVMLLRLTDCRSLLLLCWVRALAQRCFVMLMRANRIHLYASSVDRVLVDLLMSFTFVTNTGFFCCGGKLCRRADSIHANEDYNSDFNLRNYRVGQKKRSNFETRPFKNYTFVLIHIITICFSITPRLSV